MPETIASAKRLRPYGQLLDWSASTYVDGRVFVTAPGGQEFAAGSGDLDASKYM